MTTAVKAKELPLKPPGSETPGPPPEDPNSPEAKQRRADELQRRLDALLQGSNQAASHISLEGADRREITGLKEELDQLRGQGITSSVEPRESKASYSYPDRDSFALLRRAGIPPTTTKPGASTKSVLKSRR